MGVYGGSACSSCCIQYRPDRLYERFSVQVRTHIRVLVDALKSSLPPSTHVLITVQKAVTNMLLDFIAKSFSWNCPDRFRFDFRAVDAATETNTTNISLHRSKYSSVCSLGRFLVCTRTLRSPYSCTVTMIE